MKIVLRNRVLVKVIKQPLLVVLLIGLIFRLILAPFTGHTSDIALWASIDENFYLLQFNPLYGWSGLLFPSIMLFFYPFYLLLSYIGLGNILTQTLVIKIPFILTDLFIGILLYKIAFMKTKNRVISNIVASSWIFNPFVIFVSSIHGMYDSIPVFFLLLSVFFLFDNKWMNSLISLGISSCIKIFPLFLFPLWIFYLWKKTSKHEKILSFMGFIVVILINYLPMLVDPILYKTLINYYIFQATGIGTVGVTIGMIGITIQSFWRYFLTNNVLNYFPIFIKNQLFISSFIPFYFLIIAFIYRRYRKYAINDIDLLRYSVVIMLLIMPLNPNNSPHHLLWVFPFLLYLSLHNKKLVVMLNILWMLNLVSLFTYAPPINYLRNLYPEIPFVFGSQSSINLGFFYSLSLLTSAIFVLILKIRPLKVSLKEEMGLQRILFRNWRSISCCMIIILLMFSEIEVKGIYLPNHFVDRDRFNSWSILPSEVNIYENTYGGVASFKFEIDVVPFMNERVWNATYARVSFNNLPPNINITLKGKTIPISSNTIEIPRPGENLEYITQIRAYVLPFQGLQNGRFEGVLDNWIYPKEEASIDNETFIDGKGSLKTVRSVISGWINVYQDMQMSGVSTLNVRVWIRTENVLQSHFKIAFFTEEGKLLRLDIFPQSGIDGTRDWCEINQQITTPAKTQYMRIYCMGGASLDGVNPGITWFDNVIISTPSTPSISDIKAILTFGFDLDNVRPWWRENLSKIIFIIILESLIGFLLLTKSRKWLLKDLLESDSDV